jgi:hypothetical protein
MATVNEKKIASGITLNGETKTANLWEIVEENGQLFFVGKNMVKEGGTGSIRDQLRNGTAVLEDQKHALASRADAEKLIECLKLNSTVKYY